MVFDDLSVRISAETINFSRKISGAQEDLGDLTQQSLETAGGLQVLQNRADEAGDEIGQAGRSAGTTSGLFSTLSFSTGGLATNFTSLATTATLATVGIGALTAGATALASTIVPLSAVLATVAGGAAALAGAFGMVIGTGILAFGKERGAQNEERLKQIKNNIAGYEDQVDAIESQIDQLEELREKNDGLTASQQEQLQSLMQERNETERLIDKKEELAKKVEKQTGIMGGLKDAFGDLKEEITPIITQFGEKFVPLIEDALDALPTLVDDIINASEAAGGFVKPLRTLGRIASRVIPEMTFLMLEFAQIALPVFKDFIGFLRVNADQALGGMLRITRELAPQFMRLIDALVSPLPEIARLGTAVLKVLIPAFTGFIETVEDIINIGESSDGIVGFIKTLVNDALEWVTGTGLPIIGGIGGDIISGITDALAPGGEGDGFTSALTDRISDLLKSAEEWLNSGGTTKISNFVTSMMAAIKNQLDQISKGDIKGIINSVTSILGSVFDALVTSAQSDEANALGGRIGELARTMVYQLGESMLGYVFSQEFLNDMVQVALAVLNSLGAVLGELFSTKYLVNAILGEGTYQDFGLGELRGERSPPDTSNRNQTTNIEIEVTGDSQIVEDISAKVMSDKERYSNRNTGRTTPNF